MAKFKVVSDYEPSGDQPKAIEALSSSIKAGNQYNTLLGVTGSGKTYTIAKVIEKVQKPTLIMTHNKTLAAQLYSEFKQFFPNNHVEYFISYYDYYQPEAYIPRSDLFIEKDSSINDELERLRLSATASLLSFDDVIVIASVSANYGLGNPSEYKAMVQRVEVGFNYSQKEFLLKLIEMGYKRNDKFFDRADFRVNGDVIDIFPAYFEDEFIRVEFFGDEVESITKHEYITNTKTKDLNEVIIYSVNPFVVTQENLGRAVKEIEEELEQRLDFFQKEQKLVEYQRLKQRVEFDLEMIEGTGMCKGIENYARHLTGQKAGETPYSLLDYFEQMDEDFLLVVDESHVSLPQFRGMHAADRSRKEVLVEYGFRLPSALDNRPLKFDEFIKKAPHYVFVSATPNELELEMSSVVAEQIIRPTGLLDPIIDIIDSEFQVEKLHDEIKKVIAKNERVLVTVLTKKMAEELASYYADLGIKVKYMHSEIDAIERNQIIRELRLGTFDVLIGINLLREGLDIPETSLVAILDADKEGFLRSRTSLIQTIGRAARNENGRVILFAKKVTDSMQFAIDETNRRRKLQEEFNKEHNITPKSTKRKLDENLKLEEYDDVAWKKQKLEKMPASERKKILIELNKQMKKAASDLNFEEAIRLRDEIAKIKDI
ncbi:excinuclease ABC subunit UvrB [Aliarcobacter butzleri]|uniref:excinuclease ABC subunit UvrB n=1 Tax=Aliarcobacter butzleri TaxID=28197 RepID=UPI0001F15431|nr:excinuclease ABC subunit UvrB [Aliarcobacter butzleri]EFU70373.1 excision endonuclease subunit UvrB [Aliarcobacter butzleri JV22]MCG3660053.1 excinuclease ABC subunit UvrB [Aliarcobacter butzleri]MCG3679386.1 excinuclease ABC subunit UvrB [Aliarcobacter butzleri]MCG3693182.1 excinuclease ABC subunit UvrB [Aliarcobacter butzleri]MCT7582011.1 excinuclease ABC subunit UvrB [Aliarcobacter butzleri]